MLKRKSIALRMSILPQAPTVVIHCRRYLKGVLSGRTGIARVPHPQLRPPRLQPTVVQEQALAVDLLLEGRRWAAFLHSTLSRKVRSPLVIAFQEVVMLQ